MELKPPFGVHGWKGVLVCLMIMSENEINIPFLGKSEHSLRNMKENTRRIQKTSPTKRVQSINMQKGTPIQKNKT